MTMGAAYMCEAVGCEGKLVSWALTPEQRHQELDGLAFVYDWQTKIDGPILCAKHKGTTPALQNSHCYKCGIGLKPPETLCDRCRVK